MPGMRVDGVVLLHLPSFCRAEGCCSETHIRVSVALSLSTLERMLQRQGHVKLAGTCQNE